MKHVRLAVALVLSVLFLLFLWPTPYDYLVVPGTVLRINRITGAVSELTTDGGWHRMRRTDALRELGLPEP